jgi:ethanolamine utilization protein EutN
LIKAQAKDQRPKTKDHNSNYLRFTIDDSLVMFLGKVVGTVWSTKKTPDLEGIRFLVVHPYDLEKDPTRNIVIVADRLGAGTGEMVMCAFGKAARTAMGNQDMAIEAAVVGIVDRVDITDTVSEEMREAAVKLARDNGRR